MNDKNFLNPILNEKHFIHCVRNEIKRNIKVNGLQKKKKTIVKNIKQKEFTSHCSKKCECYTVALSLLFYFLCFFFNYCQLVISP